MLNFLVWVILIYFVLLLFWRYILPFLLKRFVKRVERKFMDASQNAYNQSEIKKDGEVSIDHIPESSKKTSTPNYENDYVEFEEIKNTENKE
jgi:hypothetical protein